MVTLEPKIDHQIRELGRIVLKLRADLVFTPQTLDGKPGYLIEDPVTSKYYRIGIAEYRFISLLDGSTSVADALHATAATLGDQAFTQDETASIAKWLVDTGLAHTPESAQTGRLMTAAHKAAQSSLLPKLNPLFIRLPVMQPDPFLKAIAPWLGWLHGPLGWGLFTVLAFVAGANLLPQWDRFLGAADGILAPGRWLWLGLSWLGLKIVHETSHGLVCKRYGGSVREVGIVFILFAPLACVDVTSSWRFASKWQRIHTAIAGMYIELLFASIAAIVWCHTDVGPLNDIAFNVVLMASLTTILFNANPLMRFDGYYVLSDFLEIPNLYTNGQRYLLYLGSRYLLGLPSTCPRWTQNKDGIIRLYGIAAMIWRILVSATLLIAATAMFAGAGLVLGILAGIMWLGVPLARFCKFFASDPSLTSRQRGGFVLKLASAAAASSLLLTTVPWPGTVSAPAIVEFAPMAVVRAGSPGFVENIQVANGQTVAEGAPLVVLTNHQLRNELADLLLEIESTQLLCRSYENQGRLAEFQAEIKRLESLDKQRRQKEWEVDQLIVRAPTSGQVIGRNLDALLGTYVAQGAEVIGIGNQLAKEIQISVSQEDVDVFTHQIQQPVTVRVRGGGRLFAPLESVSPRASVRPPHQALCAPHGGPLAVKPTPDAEDSSQARTYETVAPRFVAVVALDEQSSKPLRAGQTGVATFWDRNDTIGKHLYESFRRWIRKKFEEASTTS